MYPDRKHLQGWLLPVVLYALLAALKMGGSLWSGDVPNDDRMQYLPNAVVTLECLQQGVPPLWNPYIFSGLPHLASHHSAALYPPVWLFFSLFEPFNAFNLLQAFHYFWLGLGTWALLAHGWRLKTPAALLGGVLFMFAGFNLAHEAHGPLIWATAWVPWICWCSRAVLRGRRWAGPALAAALALHIAAGYMQLTIMSLMVIGCEALVLVRLFGEKPARRLTTWAGAIGLGIALQGVQFLTTMEVIPFTHRTSNPFSSFSDLGIPLPQIVTLLFPYAFGGGWPFTLSDKPVGTIFQRSWFGLHEPAEMHGAMGAVALIGLLLLVGLPRAAHAGGDARILRISRRFWWGVGFFSFSLLFGDRSPLMHLLYHVPGLNLFRIQTRWMVYFDFAFAILAANGFDRLVRDHFPGYATANKASLPRVLKLGGFGLITVVPSLWLWLKLTSAHSQMPLDWSDYFSNWFSPWNPAIGLTWLFLACAMSMLLLIHWRPRLLTPAFVIWTALCTGEQMLLAEHVTMQFAWPHERFTIPGNAVATELLQRNDNQPGNFRTLTMTDEKILQPPETMPILSSPLAGLHAAGGYWPFINPFYGKLLKYSLVGETLEPLSLARRHAILDMLNIRYLLVGPYRDGWSLDPWQKGVTPDPPLLMKLLDSKSCPSLKFIKQTDTGVSIIENTTAMPRAWLVERLTPIADRQQAIDHIWDDRIAFNPTSEALVEPDASGNLPAQLEHLASGSLRVVKRLHDRLWLRARADGPAFMVLSETWYPGWWARVNGRPSTTWRVNGVLRGIELPAGESEVYLRYLPEGFKRGAIISLLAAISWLAWACVLTWRNGHRSERAA